MKKEDEEFLVSLLDSRKKANDNIIISIEGKVGEVKDDGLRKQMNEQLHDLRKESDKCISIKIELNK